MKKNKAVILFLLRFFVSYFILSVLYQWYIAENQETAPVYKCCPITNTVTKHSVSLGNLTRYNFKSIPSQDEVSNYFYINNRLVSRIIEGCNGISVIILFWAFIIAFKGKFKETILFGLVGSILIYALNIFRIDVIAIGLYEFPDYTELLHQILFPAIIYGFVFLLWVVWVKYFAIKEKKNV
jgi:exosortase family protein XrtF